MVRLEETLIDDIDLSPGNFNSSMVRLEEEKLIKELQKLPEFQFQYGAIRRYISYEYSFRRFIDFNSSMVRLEGCYL